MKKELSIISITTLLISTGIFLSGMLAGITFEHPYYYLLGTLVSTLSISLFSLALNKIFGKLGSIILFILFILQIILSSNLFPQKLLGNLGSLIYNLLPGTYIVNLLNGNNLVISISIVILIAFISGVIYFLGDEYMLRLKTKE